MNIRLNKEKSIGKVLYIVEGGKTEPYLLHHIFCNILDYQLETILRDKGYRKYNSKENVTSQVFVINAEESNIKNISRDNKFLDNMFRELIENYEFDVDNAAIFYLFDRDSKSNTDDEFIENMLSILVNSRDNGFERQGILLLSYPSVESFTFSNFIDGSFNYQFETGNCLKQHLHNCKINQRHITEDTLKHATRELFYALNEVDMGEIDMNLQYKFAALADIDTLTNTRIKVLRAANKLDESIDMSVVKKESYNYYCRALAAQTHVAILVYDGNEIVGTGGVSFFEVMPTYHNPSGKKAYIMNMYTEPEYRRQGIAYRTLDMLIDEVRKRGIEHITLEATELGRPLYEKYGFVKMNNEMEYRG